MCNKMILIFGPWNEKVLHLMLGFTKLQKARYTKTEKQNGFQLKAQIAPTKVLNNLIHVKRRVDHSIR